MKTLIKFCLSTLLTVILVVFIQQVIEQQSLPKKLLDSNTIQQVLEKLPFGVGKDTKETPNNKKSSYKKNSDSTEVKMNIDEKEPEQETSEGKNANESLVILIENIDSLREAIKREQVVLIAKRQDKVFILDTSETVTALSSDVTRNTKISPYFVTSNLVDYYKDDFLLKGVTDMTQVRVYMTVDLVSVIAKNATEISLPHY